MTIQGAAFIIRGNFGHQRPLYVSARPGYAAKGDGTVYRDGTDPFHSGPEWTQRRELAYRFKSHRAAARVANTCDKAVIVAV